MSLHRACNGDWKSLGEKSGVSQEELQHFLEYAAQFLGNCGNYKGFGDSKFIPRISEDAFKKLASVAQETKNAFETASKTGGGIYETSPDTLMHLGYPEDGHMTTYYPDSPTITKEEITLIGDFLEKKKLLLENTRLRKTKNGDFELLIASAQKDPAGSDRDVGDVSGWPLEGKLEGKNLALVYGDYTEELAKISESAKQASMVAANDTQKKMYDEYAKSFTTGSLEAFKESQRYWIKDKGPMVESDLGFVETYRDPHGVRGEWEGFAAMVRLDPVEIYSLDLANPVCRLTRSEPRLLRNWSQRPRHSYRNCHGAKTLRKTSSTARILLLWKY